MLEGTLRCVTLIAADRKLLQDDTATAPGAFATGPGATASPGAAASGNGVAFSDNGVAVGDTLALQHYRQEVQTSSIVTSAIKP